MTSEHQNTTAEPVTPDGMCYCQEGVVCPSCEATELGAQGEADELIDAYDDAVRRQRESGFQPPAAQQAARACVEHNRNRLHKALAAQPRDKE